MIATKIRIIGYVSAPMTFLLGLARLLDLLVQLDEHEAHLAGDLARPDDLDPVVFEDRGDAWRPPRSARCPRPPVP